MAKKRSSFIREEYAILGGLSKVLKTKQSNVYQLRMRVSNEKKYLRETLKTRDLDTALERTEKRTLEIYANIKAGKKIFGVHLGELVGEYLEYRQEDVAVGNITSGRLVTVSSQLKHLLKFKGDHLRIGELEKNSCFDYANWRRGLTPSVKDVTIRNETATINALMRFAYRKGYSHFETFEFRKLSIRTEETDRRDTLTLDEYDNLVRYLRTWCSKKATGKDKVERLKRLLVRDCILIATDTMLRVGELWQLRWADVLGYESIGNEQNRVDLVKIKVRAETAKNRKSRTVLSRGGKHLKRLFQRTQFRDDDHYIFAIANGRKRAPKEIWYNAWKELMSGIGIDYKSRNLTWYSLRHFGITCRLRAGASVFDVSKLAGTSVSFIDTHYGHFDDAMAREVALKNFRYGKDGIAIKD